MSPGRRLRVGLLLYFAKDLPAAKGLGLRDATARDSCR